jgi:hypothetical protein
MRQFISKYGAYLAGGLIVLAAIIVFATRSSTPGLPTRAFYIDEETGEESLQPATSVPPLNNKNGKPTLVQVMKFSCEKPGKVRGSGANAKVGYYRKYTPEAKRSIEQPPTDIERTEEAERLRTEGEFVRLPAPGSPWVRAISEEGERIVQSIQCAPGEQRYVVFP